MLGPSRGQNHGCGPLGRSGSVRALRPDVEVDEVLRSLNPRPGYRPAYEHIFFYRIGALEAATQSLEPPFRPGPTRDKLAKEGCLEAAVNYHVIELVPAGEFRVVVNLIEIPGSSGPHDELPACGMLPKRRDFLPDGDVFEVHLLAHCDPPCVCCGIVGGAPPRCKD